MSAAYLLFVGALIGFGLGFLLGIIFDHLIMKMVLYRYLPFVITSPEGQHVIHCVGKCLERGLKLGTPDFANCVQECLQRSDKPHAVQP